MQAPKSSKQFLTSKGIASRGQETLLILAITAALFILFALISYQQTDPGWSRAQAQGYISNLEGLSGAWTADFLFYFLGYTAFIIPTAIGIIAWVYFRIIKGITESNTAFRCLNSRLTGLAMTTLTLCSMASLYVGNVSMLPASAGGVIGQVIGWHMLQLFSSFGSALISIACLLIGASLMSRYSLLFMIEKTGEFCYKLAAHTRKTIKDFDATRLSLPQRKTIEPASTPTEQVVPTPSVEPTLVPLSPTAPTTPALVKTVFEFPPLELLDKPKAVGKKSYSNQQLQMLSRDVEMRLLDFGVEVKVVAVNPGPVVTRFELQLAAGTKVSKISGLAKDLARSLSVNSVRVVEIIPGKSVIGLELPNIERETVRLIEVVKSQQYTSARSPLTLALGKDISGHPIVVDLGKMPHLLVAGTTGSGKSVGLNAMLLSLLYKATPDQLKLILIDPKMLELSTYSDIPHLLTPVITDMREAANSLRWCVAEMERRYRLMASVGVRNLQGYNAKIQRSIKAGKPIADPLWTPESGGEAPMLEPLPSIVVLADEFADLMMVAGKKIETLICRIAQKARAAGIHLILATQRPSVDVITGLIKANVPTRIAFQVSSKIDSRVILDQGGADQLLGHGDMLYLPPGSGVPVRVHGAFVSDDEVHRVVKQLKKTAKPEYLTDITTASHDTDMPGSTDSANGDNNGKDPLYDQAVAIVTKTRRASISNVQRRLKIGYNRAATIVEAMEEAGIVSAMENNGSREVLVPEGAGEE